MLGISGTELAIILFFGFLIFGPEKLPQMGRTVGRAIRQFRQASETMNQKFKDEVADPFQEAVSPYKDEVEKQAAPLKEDLAAISKNLNETTSVFTDPFKDALSFDPTGSKSTEPAKPRATVIGDVATGSKQTAAADDPFAETLADSKPSGEGKPLPSSGGAVKKSMAASLYGLDDAGASGSGDGE